MATETLEQVARVKVLIAERRYQDAVRACRRALLSEPGRVDVRLLLGQALLLLERYEEARIEMLALTRDAPTEATAFRILAEAYIRAGFPDKARDAIGRAVALDPADTGTIDLRDEIERAAPQDSERVQKWFDPEALATMQSDVSGDLPEEATGHDHRPPTAPARPDGLHSDDDLEPPRGDFMVSGLDASVPDLPGEPTIARVSDLPEERTTARDSPKPRGGSHRKAKRGDLPREGTQALDISEIEEVHDHSGELEADDSEPSELENERTVARPGSMAPPAPSRAPSAVAPRAPSAVAPRAPSVPPPRPSAPPPPADPTPPPAPARERFNYAPAPALSQPPRAPAPRPSSIAPRPPTSPALPDTSAPSLPPAPAPEPTNTNVPNPAPAPPPGASALEPRPYLGASASNQPRDEVFKQPSGAPPALEPLAPASKTAPPRKPDAVPLGAGPALTPAPAAKRLPIRDASSAIAAVRSRIPPWPWPPRFRKVVAGSALVVVLVASLISFLLSHLADGRYAQMRAAADQATDDGLPASFQRALGLIEASGDDDARVVALRARLLATLSLEHSVDSSRVATDLLRDIEIDEDAASDVLIAATYLSILASQADRASELGRRLAEITEAQPNAEALRARAIASWGSGDTQGASAIADGATKLRPGSPRHTSLAALYTSARDPATGLRMLSAVPTGTNYPVVRVAFARILFDRMRDPAAAREQVQAVLGPLASQASAAEVAWAHLLNARIALSQDDTTVALNEARAALQGRPVADDEFTTGLVEVFLRTGATDEARNELTKLGADTRSPARTRLRVQVALALGDLDGATRELVNAGTDGETELLRGRLAEARGELAEAQEAYTRAIRADGTLFGRAQVRIAAVKLKRGEVAEAANVLELARAQSPADAEVVGLLVRAKLALGDRRGAERVLNESITRNPTSADLRAARAMLALDGGDVRAAVEDARAAVTRRPNDPNMISTFALAAYRARMVEETRGAVDRLLQIDASAPIGLALATELALDAGDTSRAYQYWSRLPTGPQSDPNVARARARYFVEAGAGALGLQQLANLSAMQDPVVWIYVGRLRQQAEQRDARAAFERALAVDAGNPEAMLGVYSTGGPGDLDAIGRAAEQRQLPPAFFARLFVEMARQAYNAARFNDAARLLEDALRRNPRSGEALELRASVNLERGQSSGETPDLQAAVNGLAPPPAALARLALRTDDRARRCELAQRYLQTAPRGSYASDMRALSSRGTCSGM